MRISDWSLDVCSSDLYEIATLPVSYRPPARFAYTGYNLSTETAVGLTISADGIIRARAAITSGHIVDITSPMFIPDCFRLREQDRLFNSKITHDRNDPRP